jgi:transposase
MKETDLLQKALGLTAPWKVVSVDFDSAKGRLDIKIDFEKGARFDCPSCGVAGCPVHDTETKQWRHLNFFQHETYLHARVPRAGCSDCGPHVVDLPWARLGSGFTLLFEALIMTLAKQMPVNAIARLVNEHDTRVWRVLNHYVDQARKQVDMSNVRRVGVDETSRRKRHKYVTVFVDLDRSRVLYATKGKGASEIESFAQDLEAHGGNPSEIEEVCSDMSPSFISGVAEHLPKAELTFDKFHVMKILNEAVDKVRIEEAKQRPELKGSKFLWLMNPGNLKERHKAQLDPLRMKTMNLKTARAYHIRLNFQEFWNQPADKAETFLKRWYFWATHSRLEPIKDAAYTIKRHWGGVLRWFTSRITNGILEGINSLIQAAKARARGYRSARNFITMVYITAGKLKFDLPT